MACTIYTTPCGYPWYNFPSHGITALIYHSQAVIPWLVVTTVYTLYGLQAVPLIFTVTIVQIIYRAGLVLIVSFLAWLPLWIPHWDERNVTNFTQSFCKPVEVIS